MRQATPVLEVRNRRGHTTLRAVGPIAIYAALALQLLRWAGIVAIAIAGVPFLP